MLYVLLFATSDLKAGILTLEREHFENVIVKKYCQWFTVAYACKRSSGKHYERQIPNIQ